MSAQAQIVSFKDAKKAAKTRPKVAASKKPSQKTAASKTASKPLPRQAKPSERVSASAKTASNKKPSVKKTAAQSKKSASASATKAKKTTVSSQKKTRSSASGIAKEEKSSKFTSIARKSRKEKADKSFARMYGGDTSSNEPKTATPRAALYKGEMGSTHKKAARMQNESAQAKKSSFSLNAPAGIGRIASKMIKGAAVAVCLALACAFIYPTAQQYYVTTREYQQLQAEYGAIQERNDALQREVDSLSTTEGIEDEAREEFGWVKEGENAVNVYGLENQDDDSRYSKSIQPGSIAAPETWYSPFLDPLFGVE